MIHIDLFSGVGMFAYAMKKAGIDGERSGLWSEFARIIGDLRPRYVIIENVSALLTGAGGRWFDRVLIDLAEIGGYEVEWHVIPAGNPDGLSAGAPHRRERVWIICRYVADANNTRAGQSLRSDRGRTEQDEELGRVAQSESGTEGFDVADTECQRQQGQGQPINTSDQTQDGKGQANQPVDVGERGIGSIKPSLGLLADGLAARLSRSRWLPEPGIGRVATGVPDRVNKLKALGNGLVWQIPYAIVQTILENEQ